MTRAPLLDAAIVGAGLAGSIVASSLARDADASYRAVLFDPRPAGPGTGYRTASDRLLMNGPARAMSAMPGDEAHLVRYLGPGSDDRLIARSTYGRYAAQTLSDALNAHRGICVERASIVDIEREDGTYALIDSRGVRRHAKNVVLALGNHAPDDSSFPSALRSYCGYVGDPWTFDPSSVSGNGIALIGSGLTAMDVIALLEEHEYDGTIHLISRHGLLPAIENTRARGLDREALGLDVRTPYRLLRSMRAAARAHVENGGDWREVAESIRGISPEIWTGWSHRDKQRFLRHLQSFWAAHRYRVPPDTERAFERFSAENRVVRYKGAVVGAEIVRDDRLRIAVGNQDRATWLAVDAVVNCTGPDGDYARLRSPLARNLVRRGLLRPDSLHLGIDATPELRVLDRSGRAQDHLFTLGPPLRGLWYEATAVPETREAAAVISRTLIAMQSSSILDAVS